MKILVVGDFRNGRLASSYKTSFEYLKVKVIIFDIHERINKLTWWLKNRIFHRLTINSLMARKLGSDYLNKNLIDLAITSKPDLILIFNGEFIMPETIKYIKELNIKVFIFHADNPFPPHYNSRPETLLCAKESDLYLIWSEALVKKLIDIGINAKFLPFGWDKKIFPFCDIKMPELSNDIIFIGGWDKEREKLLEAIAKNFNLKIWGPAYWRDRTSPRGRVKSSWQGKELTGAEAALLIANSSINLNILRTQHYTDGMADGVVMRTFEVPGSGGLLLSTRSGGAIDIFQEGSAGVYFDDIEECLNKCEYLLTRPKEASEIAKNAHHLVESSHTYNHRAAEILNFYNLFL